MKPAFLTVVIAVDLMLILNIAMNANALKEEGAMKELHLLQVWAVETIMQRIVLIAPRVMEQLGAMGIAIGLMTNVCPRVVEVVTRIG